MQVIAGSGVHTHPDGEKAGHNAAMAAVAAVHGYRPRLALVFTTDRYDQARVVCGVRAAIEDAELIGCCTGGVITSTGAVAEGVAVLVLAGDDLDVRTTFADGLRDQPHQTAYQVAQPLTEHLPPPASDKRATALILTDGLTGGLSIDESLRHITDILGPRCPLAGGAAGDNLAYEQTTLFVNGQMHGDAVALALLVSAAPVGIGVRHGWQPVGRPLVITRSERNIIYELDGRPPIEVYRELLAPQEITSENFRQVTRYHPIGFPHANGDLLVRLPLTLHPDGSIECLGMLPENAIAHIMHGQPDSLMDAARDAARHAIARLDGVPPAAAIIINCVTRPPLLGSQSEAELAAIRAEVGPDTPLIGMYSFGEFAADTGPVAFHNKTVVVYVIGQTAASSQGASAVAPVEQHRHLTHETELSLLYEISSLARDVRSLDRLCDLVLDKIVRLLGADIALLYLTDANGQQLRLHATRGVQPRHATSHFDPSSVVPNSWQQAWHWAAGDSCRAPLEPLTESTALTGALGLPLHGGNTAPVGWIYVARLWHPFTADERRLYETLAVQAASALASTLAWEQTRQQQAELAAANARLEAALADTQRAFQSMRAMSTPLIPITNEVVILPLIGTIDSQRAQQMMESLLEGVAQHRASLVILDITGVSVVDTQVAQAFLQAAQAVKLLGAQVMITGIQPQIAQTLVTLGADLSDIQTRGSLQAGIIAALRGVRVAGD